MITKKKPTEIINKKTVKKAIKTTVTPTKSTKKIEVMVESAKKPAIRAKNLQLKSKRLTAAGRSRVAKELYT